MMQMNLFTKPKNRSRLTDLEKELVEKEPGRRVGKGDIGIDTYTLLYLKEVTKKDLLYNTGKSSQYSIIT